MVFIICLLISSSCIASNEMIMCSEMFDSGEIVVMANLKVLFSHYCKMTEIIREKPRGSWYSVWGSNCRPP